MAAQVRHVLKIKDAAAYIGVSPWKLRNLCHERKITYICDGEESSAWRFLISDLDAYLQKYRVECQ